MRAQWLVVVGLVACVTGEEAAPPDYWEDTVEDDGSDGDPLAVQGGKTVRVVMGETDSAELVKELPIGTSENNAKRVTVLRLRDVPDLKRGDRLIVPAEVEFTTRCDIGQSAPGCNYNPTVRVQLVLDGKRIATREQSCTANEHHCLFTFTASDAAIDVTGNEQGPVELVAWAWDSKARGGGQDKLLVGGNEGNYLDNGVVEGDYARIMAIRERGLAAGDRVKRESSGQGGKSINTNTISELVYSHELKPGGALEPGEQYYVEAKLVVETASRARTSSMLFLTKNKDATDGNGVDAVNPAAINEHNGINCTGGTCTIRKVAVFTVTERMAGPVYVNLIMRSAVPGGGSTNVTAKRGEGFIRSVRYRSSLK